MRKRFVSAILLIAICNSACQQRKNFTGGLSPQDALTSFVLSQGFKIELVAAEPLVADPIAMEVDEKGDIYVVEMHGYPLDQSGSGIIKLLTDTNDDGFPDKSEIFADKLKLPSGIMRWKKGVLVTDVPDVLYLEDSDGDGKADLRKTILTGFAVSNPQHNANTPMFGLDNWIYIPHEAEVTPKLHVKEFGDTGSIIRFPDRAGAPTLRRNANGRSVRFKPDSYELEMLSGDAQFGQTFDPWGHHFLTMNYKHIYHEAIAARYLRNNPDFLVSDALQNIPDHGNAAEVYPITKNPLHQLLTDVGVVTSACGITWYQGGLFPDSFNNVTFVAEPVHNLVHADRIRDNGSSFTASRVYQNEEFLASTDPWFRPVQFYIGPDGALFMIDYYRQIIEHPEWMSEEVNNSGALYNGSDKGRIYRITTENSGKLDWCGKLNLDNASTEELVKNLSHKNIWWRRNVQRLLIDRKDEKTASYIKNFLDTTPSPIAIVHALWTLEGLRKTTRNILEKNLKHPVAGVRENAVRIAELHLEEMPALQSLLLELQHDADPKVRYQLLCTMGYMAGKEAESAVQNILIRDIEDPWVQVAVLSSSYGSELGLLRKAKSLLSLKESEGLTTFFRNCARVIGLSKRTEDIKSVIQLVTDAPFSSSRAWWQSAVFEGLSDAFNIKGEPEASFFNESVKLMSAFQPNTPASVRKASVLLLGLLPVHDNAEWNKVRKAAEQVLTDKAVDASYREDALTLMSSHGKSVSANILRQLIHPEEPENIQKRAISIYIRQGGKEACDYIIQSWKNLTPSVRNESLDHFLSSKENSNVLLDAVQAGVVQPASIGWGRMVALMNNDDVGVRSRSRKLFAVKEEGGDELYKKYQPALMIDGNPKNGALVFQKNCSVCHQVGEKNGIAFGPDLASIRNREQSLIMTDILNPNRSIADGYEMWTVYQKSGTKIMGIISTETAEAITIKDAAGKATTISRSSIQIIEAGRISGMPAGMESNISIREMADLLAFLKKSN